MKTEGVVLSASVTLAIVLAGCAAQDAGTYGTRALIGDGGAPDATIHAQQPDAPAMACLSADRSVAIIQLTDPEHPEPDCTRPDALPPQTPLVRFARVTAVEGDAYHVGLSLDFCGPGACDAVPGMLRVSTARLDLSRGEVPLQIGQLVQIEYEVFPMHGIEGCGRAVEVRNLPMWNGVPNPVRSDDAMLFFAQANGHGLFDRTLSARHVSIGCRGTLHDCAMGPEEAFGELFTIEGADVLLHEGESTTVTFDGHRYQLQLLMAYISGTCDDPGTYSWSMQELSADAAP